MPRPRGGDRVDVDPKYKVSGREEVLANLRGIGLVIRSSPLFVIVALALTAVQGLVPPAILVGLGRFLTPFQAAQESGLDSDAGRTSVEGLVIIGTAILVSQLLGPVLEAFQFGMQRRFKAYLQRRLMVAVSKLPGMAYFEDPKFRDKLEISEWIGWAPTQSVRILTQLWQQLNTIGGFVVLTAAYALWVPGALVLASIPAGLAAIYFEGVIGLARWSHSPEMRRSEYYRRLGLQLEPAKELRIFSLQDWTLSRQATHYFAGMKAAWAKRRRSLMIRLGLQVPSVAAMGVAFMAMLRDTIAGNVDAGTFTMAGMAVVGLSGMVVTIFTSASWMRRNNFYLPVAFQILDLADEDPRLDVSGTKPARGLPRSGITFEGVTFAYPGTERNVIHSLDLFIAAGSSLALVGENGAGKTTLIKLLCRMYDPSAGRILLDGVDIRELDLEDLRSRMAVIFQDFTQYHLSAQDNVGFGAVAKVGDRGLATEAARQVGVLEKIEELPEGWDTVLAREFGGVDLSGGEWQRVALARAIMAQLGQDADLLILDEPTASLDVRLEHELYEHFADISSGRTALLVSHRFSTVRMAERIVYMEEGRITEDGTHQELMALGGHYSELYEMQASHYRATGTLE